MTRPARSDEKPIFGQVWGWADTAIPLMSVGPGETFVDGSQKWVFIVVGSPHDLDDGWYWSNPGGATMEDWVLLDDD